MARLLLDTDERDIREINKWRLDRSVAMLVIKVEYSTSIQTSAERLWNIITDV